MDALLTETLIPLVYLVSTALFIMSLRWMNDPDTARRGVWAGVFAMVLAVGGTLLFPSVGNYGAIALAMVVGAVIGVPLSRVQLTAVPQRTALSHAFGGLAAGVVGTAKYFAWLHESPAELTRFRVGAIVLEVILGFITLTGSLMAAGKLQEVKWIPQRPVTFPGQNFVTFLVLAGAFGCGAYLVFDPSQSWAFAVLAGLSLTFGILLIIPIGGADMPTVIAILNAYAGLSAVAMGFVLDNKLLVTAGALDGSSGLILAIIMSKAMNRSFTNVLFGAFGQVSAAAAQGTAKSVKSESFEGAAQILEQAQRVVVVPGYGMAVSQSQHLVRELYDQLTKRHIDVRFAIHPVAGRMPGHMNVLLAEAEIPYDHLLEMDDINPQMAEFDVCIVIGANDVVNPAARHDKNSPIYGMPIIDADKARTCFAIKRSMNPGFAGIDNELYTADKTYMLFGDAKKVVGAIAKELAGGSGMH